MGYFMMILPSQSCYGGLGKPFKSPNRSDSWNLIKPLVYRDGTMRRHKLIAVYADLRSWNSSFIDKGKLTPEEATKCVQALDHPYHVSVVWMLLSVSSEGVATENVQTFMPAEIVSDKEYLE